MAKLTKTSVLLLLYACAYGTVMLSLDGIRPYEFSPYHRYQAEAFLHGHLFLSDSIQALQPGLVWYDGHVQHVWGLGIGLWLLPFEAIWRLFSHQPFPDRIALGLAFALLSGYSASTGLKLVKQGRPQLGLAVICLITLCPALWTLARASEQIFEETVLYSVIISLSILIALIRVASFGSRTDYLTCCILGSFAIWVRPTHAIYGLCAVSVSSALVWISRRSRREVFSGVTFWPVSLTALLWANSVRFGSPTEFGHRMTISSGNMMYLTRFGNPFRNGSVFQAVRELISLLFLSDPRGANTFADDLLFWQAPFTRWRRLDLTAFDPIYAVLSVTMVIVGIAWLTHKRMRLNMDHDKQSETKIVLSVLAWSVISFTGLAGFYLHYPAIASRYLLDFAPALTGFIMLIPILLPSRIASYAVPLLAIWCLYEICSAKTPIEDRPPSPQVRLAMPESTGASLESFNGAYSADHPPGETKIAGNGYGWGSETGIAADVASFALDKPQFVQLHVSGRRAQNGETAGRDTYRAQIAGIPLSLRDISPDGDSLKVTFDIPEQLRNKEQTEFLFLCFSDSYDEDSRSSERFLFSIKWK